MRNNNEEGGDEKKEDENDQPSITTRGGRLGAVRIRTRRAMRDRRKWRVRRIRIIMIMKVTTTRRGLQ